jgi:hypothetical protein
MMGLDTFGPTMGHPWSHQSARNATETRDWRPEMGPSPSGSTDDSWFGTQLTVEKSFYFLFSNVRWHQFPKQNDIARPLHARSISNI